MDNTKDAPTNFERNGVFPFMSLPPELRRKVYNYAFISSSTQPGVADWYLAHQHPELVWKYDAIVAVNLLQVCKQIYSEGVDILYQLNTFTTLYRPKGQQVWDVIEETCKSQPSFISLLPSSALDQAAVSSAVSLIFDSDIAKIPRWLCGEFPLQHVVRDSGSNVWSPHSLYGEGVDGFYLVSFLRTIGASNAAKITTVELTLDSLPNAADIFALFAEILRQHFKGLRRLIIGFDCMNDYGSEMEFDERNEYQEDHAIALFTHLRALLKDLPPQLRDIRMSGCDEEMQTMADMTVKEKRTGVAIDLEKEWTGVFEHARKCILAIPEIADKPNLGYRVEPHIYLPNWEKSWRNLCG